MDPGTVVAERFEIERHVTSGGMGAVYRARDLHTGLAVALKVMLPAESTRDPPALAGDERERFEREARALAELRHPGIVRYVDHGLTSAGEPYLAMEWLEGEDLGRRLARAPLRALESVRLACTLASTLAPAHARGVIHRDLKPSNLFLPGGDLARVRILDFGVARMEGDTRAATRSGTLLGTPGYMAPEQARGDRDVDARVDVFALGCVLFECLVGRPAFKGEHVMAVLAKILLEESPRLRDHRPDLPDALDALLASMLAKDRDARPLDAAAVAQALEALLAADVVPADALPPVERPTRASLTTGEQNVVSVVVAAEAYGLDTAVAATLTPDGATAKGERLREAVAPFGARLEVLADGSWVACMGDRGAAARGTASDRAAQAARCALVMRQHMPTAPMVLATGRAVFAGRLPVGDVIDRAARVLRPHLVRSAPSQRSAGPQPILLDDVTAGLLDVRFDIGGASPADPGAGLELRAEREVVDRTRTLLGKATPCIGRERELASLAATYDECITEPVARVVLVTAPAGVGKSRLRHEFAQSLAAHDEPPQVWLGRGDPLRAGSPFALLAPAIRRSAGILDGEPLELRRRKLRARVGRHVALEDWDRVTVFLGEMIGVSFEGEGEGADEVQLRAARQDAMLMGDQKLRAFVDFLAGECAEGPLLFILEDLHWGDGPSVKFLDAALRTLADAPLMVLALARPEASTRFPDLWAGRGVQPLALVELTAKRSGRLVRAVLGEDVDEGQVARIVERAQGNAFYLEELIRAVAEGRGDDLPETVLAMVQGRLERLDPDARRVLRAASVFGDVFWRRGVLALLGDDDDATRAESPASVGRRGAIDRWFDDLVRNEVIKRRGAGKFPGEEELSFRHALVREAAYAMLTPEDRALGHRLAGEWLDDAGESEAVVLAEHFALGGDRGRARACYRKAAEQALRANDLDAAVARAEKAMSLGADGEQLGALRCILAEAERWRGKLGEARRHAAAALEHLPTASDAWYGAAAELALSAGRLGAHEELLGLMAKLEPHGLDEGCSPSCLIAWARTSGQLLLAGKREAAARGFAHVDRVAHAFSSEPALAARVSLTRAMRSLIEGDAGAYRDHTSDAADGFQRAGDLRSACMQRVSVGYASLGLGDHDDAESKLRDALASAQRMGLANVVAYSKNNLGLTLAHKGQIDDARRMETEAIASFAAQGDGRLEHSSRVYLAQILRLAGDLVSAEREARAAIEFFRVATPLRAFALAVLAEVLLAANRATDALDAATEARGLLQELGHLEEGEALVRLVHAEALSATGDRDRAKAAIEEARRELLGRAEKIKDESRRRSFLERVPENARTMKLAGGS